MFKSYLLLLCISLACAVVAGQGTIKLQVLASSSAWWFGVLPENDNGATTTVELQDSLDTSFFLMTPNPGWGYYTYSSPRQVSPPITYRLTSSSGAQILVTVPTFTPGQLIDTGATYGASVSVGTITTLAPTTAPPPSPPTVAPPKPTTAPPSAATTKPTNPPIAPTNPPTNAPTLAPTALPTTGPTTAPTFCAATNEPVSLTVPLYVYPGPAWNNVIAAASQVKVNAVINPNSGPLPVVDWGYSTYMTLMHNAGVTLIGYVHTSYGARNITEVLADIDTWASNYPLVTGIFLDEANPTAEFLSYYTIAYNHIMSKIGYVHVLLNPGVVPDPGYLAISTSIVIYEDYASALTNVSATFPDWIQCASTAAQKTGYKYKFTGIAHTADVSIQANVVQQFHSVGMGSIYVTDGLGGCCTYNTLTSYMPLEATTIQEVNS